MPFSNGKFAAISCNRMAKPISSQSLSFRYNIIAIDKALSTIVSKVMTVVNLQESISW